LAGAAGRLVRPVPVARRRREDRPRAADRAAADSVGRECGRRGLEDCGAVAARARGGAIDRERGALRRAVRPRRLQRCVHRPAGVPGMSRTAVIACGALAADVRKLARTHGWDVDVHPVPALLHNRPEQIPAAVAAEAGKLSESYDRVAVAYGDCGTYGELDRVLDRAGIARLQAEHCYELIARDDVRAALGEEPGTYFLTDFLAR